MEFSTDGTPIRQNNDFYQKKWDPSKTIKIKSEGTDLHLKVLYSYNLSLCVGLFLVPTPPTPPNNQLKWIPPEFLESDGL